MKRLLPLPTWSLVAAVVIMQTPVMLAGKYGASHNAHVDREIAHIEKKHDDALKVDVIVTVDRSSSWGSVLSALHKAGYKVGQTSPRVNVIAVTVPTSALKSLEALPGVSSISIDAPLSASPLSPEASLTSNVTKTLVKKASELRTQLGLTDTDPTGNGIGVAIVDSGIAPVSDFTGRIVAFYDFTGGRGVAAPPVDGYGHGTHVAGLVAGNGGLSNGQYAGVAPNARLIGLRVLNNDGNGSTSDVIAAIDFAIANKAALGIDI